jgi:hypothetical protein
MELNEQAIIFGEGFEKQGFPNKDRYQVLCYNCNCAKDKNGICPHKNMGSDGCQI